MPVRKPTPLKEQAYEEIRKALADGEIKPDFIYSEQWFTDCFFKGEISRTPVREALLQLRTEGILEVHPNRGFVIKRPTMVEAHQIFQMRAALEGYSAAYLAKKYKTPEGIAALDRIEEGIHTWRKSKSYHDCIQFHVETIAFTKNPLFISQFDQLRIKINIFWQELMEREERQAEVDCEHSEILRYMRIGDSDNAYKASLSHSQISFNGIKKFGDFMVRETIKL